MKKTYFLDKIYNANFKEFDNLIKAIIKDLNQEKHPYTFFKKDDKWLIEIERENDLISVVFDDYTMVLNNNVKNLSGGYTNLWRKLFITFLTKKQALQYNKNLEEQAKDLKLNIENQKQELNSFIKL